MVEVAGALLSLALLAVFVIGAVSALLPRIRVSLPRPRFSSTFVFCAAVSTVLIVIGSSKTNSLTDRLMRSIVSRLVPPLSTNIFPFGFAIWPFDGITAGVVTNMETTGELAIPDAMLATGLALHRVSVCGTIAYAPQPIPANSMEVDFWCLFDVDNRCVSALLPFAFPLGDAEYNCVDIFSNGRLSFGDTTLHRHPSGGIAAATNLFCNAFVIAPAWGDTVLATWNAAAVLVATNSNSASIAWRNAFNPDAPSATNSLVECTLGRDGSVSWRYCFGDASFFTNLTAGVVASTNVAWSLIDDASLPWLTDATNASIEATLVRVGGEEWAFSDDDGDGLTNYEEFLLSTNPNCEDTDGDGPNDGWEAVRGFSPIEADAPPAMPDTDGDGVPDVWELRMGTNPNSANAYPPCCDRDGDGFTDEYETDYLHSSKYSADSPELPIDGDCAILECAITSSIPCRLVFRYDDDADGSEEVRLAWVPGISPECVNLMVDVARPALLYLEREETAGYWRCSLSVDGNGAALDAVKTRSSDDGWFTGVASMRSGGSQRGEEFNIDFWRLDLPSCDISFCHRLSHAEIMLGELAHYSGTVSWSSDPAGISGTGNPLSFNPSQLTPGTYLVTASVSPSSGTYSKTITVHIRMLNVTTFNIVCDSRDTTTHYLPIDENNSFIPEGEDYYVISDPPGIDSVEFVPAELAPGTRYAVDIWNGDCGYITVTVITAHVEFELEATDPPGPRSDIGVGEVVICTASPAGLNILWSCTPGLADLSNESGPTATVSARDMAGNLNISANFEGFSFSTNYLVHVPEGIAYADPFMELSYGYGCIAAGSKLNVVVAPTNVSFSNVIIMEEECEVSYAGGWFASGNRSQRYTHTPAFGANNPVKLVFSKDLNGYYFGDIVEVDTEAWYDRTGLMHWHIPVNWWVDRIGRNNKHPFNEGFFLMEFTVLLDNTAIVEKFNTKTIRSTNGQTERYDSNGQKKTD